MTPMTIALLFPLLVASSGIAAYAEQNSSKDAEALGLELRKAAEKGQTDTVRMLLERGAPINSKDKDGKTALMMAAENGRVEVVKLLLEKRASPFAVDGKGQSARDKARLKGKQDVVALLPDPQAILAAARARIAAADFQSRISRLRTYEAEMTLTEDVFLADGWTVRDAAAGGLGIVNYATVRDPMSGRGRIRYTIGTFEKPMPEIAADFFQRSFEDSRAVSVAAAKGGIPFLTNYPPATVTCTLEFDDGKLTKLVWVNR